MGAFFSAQAGGPQALPARAVGVILEYDLVGVSSEQPVQKLLRGTAGFAEGLDDPERLPVGRHRPPGAGVDDHHAHRRDLDQGLEIGPRVDDGGSSVKFIIHL